MFERHPLAKSGDDLRARLGRQHVPHFCFAPAAVMEGGVGVVRMHLYRQLLRGEEKLYQEGQGLSSFKPGCFKPDLADFRARLLNQGSSRVEPQTFSRNRGSKRFSCIPPILGTSDDKTLQPVQTTLQLLHGSRVGDADMIVGPEGLARHECDVLLGQQFLGELHRGRDVIVERDAYVGIGVKRTLRRLRLDSRNVSAGEPARNPAAAGIQPA